jgi:hypothetical protein
MKQRAIVATSSAVFVAVMLGTVHGGMNPKVTCVPGVQMAEPVIHFVAGSTVKVEQLLGEEDKENHQPTLSRTETRYGIQGTDLGNSFEHDGRVYFYLAILWGASTTRLTRSRQLARPTRSRACAWISSWRPATT